MVPRLKSEYKNTIIPSLMKKNSYKSVMQVPRLERIVLNMGLGRLSESGKNNKIFEESVEELSLISGQKPVITRAKKSIASFKLREGVPIGCMVTLRGNKMYEFFDRLINLALPRVRDFKGVSPNSFDGRGNYTFGIREQIIFPEIDYSKVQQIKGLNITVVTSSDTDDEAKDLLESFGVPFIKN